MSQVGEGRMKVGRTVRWPGPRRRRGCDIGQLWCGRSYVVGGATLGSGYGVGGAIGGRNHGWEEL